MSKDPEKPQSDGNPSEDPRNPNGDQSGRRQIRNEYYYAARRIGIALTGGGGQVSNGDGAAQPQTTTEPVGDGDGAAQPQTTTEPVGDGVDLSKATTEPVGDGGGAAQPQTTTEPVGGGVDLSKATTEPVVDGGRVDQSQATTEPGRNGGGVYKPKPRRRPAVRSRVGRRVPGGPNQPPGVPQPPAPGGPNQPPGGADQPLATIVPVRPVGPNQPPGGPNQPPGRLLGQLTDLFIRRPEIWRHAVYALIPGVLVGAVSSLCPAAPVVLAFVGIASGFKQGLYEYKHANTNDPRWKRFVRAGLITLKPVVPLALSAAFGPGLHLLPFVTATFSGLAEWLSKKPNETERERVTRAGAAFFLSAVSSFLIGSITSNVLSGLCAPDTLSADQPVTTSTDVPLSDVLRGPYDYDGSGTPDQSGIPNQPGPTSTPTPDQSGSPNQSGPTSTPGAQGSNPEIATVGVPDDVLKEYNNLFNGEPPVPVEELLKILTSGLSEEQARYLQDKGLGRIIEVTVPPGGSLNDVLGESYQKYAYVGDSPINPDVVQPGKYSLFQFGPGLEDFIAKNLVVGHDGKATFAGIDLNSPFAGWKFAPTK